mgnify:CR=1 FL=1
MLVVKIIKKSLKSGTTAQIKPVLHALPPEIFRISQQEPRFWELFSLIITHPCLISHVLASSMNKKSKKFNTEVLVFGAL